jgi:hypothetical protein
LLLDLVNQREVFVALANWISSTPIAAIGPGWRFSIPHRTTYSTDWQTLSHVLRNDPAVSCQDSFLGQTGTSSRSTWRCGHEHSVGGFVASDIQGILLLGCCMPRHGRDMRHFLGLKPPTTPGKSLSCQRP